MLSLVGCRKVVAAAVVSVAGLAPNTSSANDFTAEKVLFEMSPAEQYSYLAGLTEGLAYSRYRSDGQADEGMNCIYSWFYDEDGTVDTILAAFARFQDRAPGAIMGALAQRRCGA